MLSLQYTRRREVDWHVDGMGRKWPFLVAESSLMGALGEPPMEDWPTARETAGLQVDGGECPVAYPSCGCASGSCASEEATGE